MKRAGEIFSWVCITLIIGFHLVQAFKPFEWQRKAAEKIDYQAFFQNREMEKRRMGFSHESPFQTDFDFETDFEFQTDSDSVSPFGGKQVLYVLEEPESD